MNERLIAWLNGLPALQLALVICGFFVAITLAGIGLVHPFMRRMIHGLPGDVPSFGVRAMLMTSASMDPRVVGVLVHAVIAHISEFQRLHPVLECLTAKEMIDWGDQTIEVKETAEEAVIGKTARVVEEVDIRKVGSERVETVRDKVRRQQIEIERAGEQASKTPPPKPPQK